jgi:hypothetical protein
MAAKPLPPRGSGGRPLKWPWLTTDVGHAFTLVASTPDSLRTTLSRTRRLYGVDFRMERRTGPSRYLVRRIA